MTNSREQNLDSIYQLLQRQLGLHRRLWECVRAEKECLVLADVKKLQDTTLSKESLIESIRVQEQERLHLVGALASQLRRPVRELILSELIITVQGFDLKRADQLRSVLQALQVLVARIQEQNRYNSELVQRTIVNIEQMKRNVLGEAAPKSSTYNVMGQKSQNAAHSRLLSKEA